MTVYQEEVLDENEDNGTMPENVDKLREAVVGHRIVDVTMKSTARITYTNYSGLLMSKEKNGAILTLDNGEKVLLVNTFDCCAYTKLNTFIGHAGEIDHIITGVGTTESYTKWHIFADFGDVLELDVGWDCGNPFYYGHGFEIHVIPIDVEFEEVEEQKELPSGNA